MVRLSKTLVFTFWFQEICTSSFILIGKKKSGLTAYIRKQGCFQIWFKVKPLLNQLKPIGLKVKTNWFKNETKVNNGKNFK